MADDDEKKEEHPAFTTIYKAVAGWQSVLMVWSVYEGLEGFYEPGNTGMGPYGHEKAGRETAEKEARSWAEDEGIEYKDPFTRN